MNFSAFMSMFHSSRWLLAAFFSAQSLAVLQQTQVLYNTCELSCVYLLELDVSVLDHWLLFIVFFSEIHIWKNFVHL